MRLGRTLLKIFVHCVNMVSNVVGDDRISKGVRSGVLKIAGAHIGPGTSLHGGTHFTAPSRLTIGRDCFVNRNCYFDLAGPIVIGNDVVIGHGCSIVTTEHHIDGPARRAGRTTPRAVEIGTGAWLGCNVIVLPGVKIGEGTVVGAGSVVTRSTTPGALVAGVPARALRSLDEPGVRLSQVPPDPLGPAAAWSP